MDNKNSRELILQRIKSSMEQGRNFPVPAYDKSSSVFPVPQDLLKTFTDELNAIGGNVILGDNIQELIAHFELICHQKQISKVFCIDEEIKSYLKDSSIDTTKNSKDFKEMQLGVTRCEFLVARMGTVVVTSGQPSGRRLNVFPPIHVVFAKSSQLVAFPEEALEKLNEKYNNILPSFISFITGASRTADIEKTLVMGAHGPKEIFVFIDKNA